MLRIILISLLLAPVAASAQSVEPLDTLPGEAVALPLAFQPVPQRSEAIATSDPLMAFVEPRWLRVTLKAVIAGGVVLQVVDLAYSEYLIGSGYGREANPALKWAAGNPAQMGIAKGVVAVGSGMLFARAAQRRPKTTLVIASIAAGFTSWVVAHNRTLYRDGLAAGLLPGTR